MIRRYLFSETDRCNMCGEPVSTAKILGMRLNKSQGVSPKSKVGISVGVMQCSHCGLNFAQPMPIPASIDDHYGLPPESYWKGPYFDIQPDYFEMQIQIAKDLLGFRRGMRALDIGAGIGKALISLGRAGFDSWGIEPSEPFRLKALELSGLPADRLQLAKVEDAKFDDRFFDFVTFGAVLEHLYDPAGSIEAALRWTKPGGIIHIEVPSSRHFIGKLLNLFFTLRGTNYVTNLSPMHSPFHLYEFTLDSFRRHATRAGYEIAWHGYSVGSLQPLPRFAHAIARAWMKYTETGMQLTVFLRRPKG